MDKRDVISLLSKIREKVNRKIVSLTLKQGILGLATSHGDIIFALFRRPRLTMAEVAEVIGKDKSTVTALVDKLVRLGYITRQRDTEDSRVIYISLTNSGRELQPAFEEISGDILAAFYAGLSEEEQEELWRLLSKVHENL